MRTKTIIPGLKNSQKIRVILNGVYLYTTVKGAHFDLFGHVSQRIAVHQALLSLATMRVDSAVGLTGSWSGCEVQVDLI